MAIIESDNFAGRTVSNSWGTASNGHVWNLLQGAATSLSVGGNAGAIANSPSTRVYASLGVTTYTDQEILVRITPSVNGADFGVAARVTFGTAITGYRFNYNGSQLVLSRVFNGAAPTTATAAKTLVANTPYWFRLKVISGTVNARVWQDGTLEPSTWDITYTDASPIASGAPGVTGSPSGGTSVAYDNFIVYDGTSGTGVASVNITEASKQTEQAIVANVLIANIVESAPQSEIVYLATSGVYIVERAQQTEIVTAQAISVSAPDAPMTTSDLAMQYQRLTGSLLAPSIVTLATILYIGGNVTTGELDAVLVGESIDALHVLQTRNDVTNFLHQYLYRLVVLQDNPLAYYRLGDGVGAVTAADSSGRANATAASVIGGVTFGVAGAIVNDANTAASFDGTSGYITLPSAFTNNVTSFSLECWLKLTNNTFASYPCIAANDFPNTSHNGFQLIVAPSTDGKSAYFTIGNGSAAFSASFGAGVLNASVWYHIVTTYDGTALKIYLNGALVGSSAANGVIGTAANNISIARYPGDTGFLPATLDEVALYTAALSPARVLAHYQAGIGIG
jgi:hypothetical protein